MEASSGETKEQQKYAKVREGMKSVMGGKVLESSTIHLDEETIAKMVNVSTSLVRKWFAES